MKPFKIGLLGLGTVGGGTVSTLHRNAGEIARRAGREIQISHVAARQYDKSKILGIDKIEKKSDDVFAVVNDPELEVVIELIGGYSPARELVLQAIKNGKHVVTANKALIAIHGNEIFAAAQEHGVIVAFEAAVGGGIPIIKGIREGLAANNILWVAGIINGTCNFILTDMQQKQENFDDALKKAQKLGYAEADPGFDIEGIDAAHKLAIIGSTAFGIPLQFEEIYVEGIDKIEQQDIFYTAQLGYRIKHLGIARKTNGGIEMRVHPTLVAEDSLIANVNGVMNAVLVKGNAANTMLYYGAGAGSEPTASAVIADVVDIARQSTNRPENRVPALAFQPDELADMSVLHISNAVTAYYLRMQVVDRPGSLSKITTILATAGISIEAVIQKEQKSGMDYSPVIFLTKQIEEKNMDKAIAEIQKSPVIKGEITRIRLETMQ